MNKYIIPIAIACTCAVQVANAATDDEVIRFRNTATAKNRASMSNEARRRNGEIIKEVSLSVKNTHASIGTATPTLEAKMAYLNELEKAYLAEKSEELKNHKLALAAFTRAEKNRLIAQPEFDVTKMPKDKANSELVKLYEDSDKILTELSEPKA